jgi:class 3 adenylate cyclase
VMAAPSQCGSLFDLLVGEETSTSSACRMVETKNSPGSRGRTTSDGWFEVTRRPSSSSTGASNYSMISMHDTTLLGELRTVAVMFVGIHMDDGGLFFDEAASTAKSSTRNCIVDSFSFLRRTEEEAAADEALLARYQSCMEIVVSTLQSRGGQLRQFIVDDKGTVCIGTFGLRGSVSDDNAAAAIDAANEIIQQLRQIDLEASIGLTLGKAYCGLVGSEERHEYSVMGPSTNLSARLMFSALPGEIRCGSAIRNRDRVHAFVPLGDVSAKGYSHPVPTFMPLFFTSKQHPKSSDEASVQSSQCETGKSRAESWSCFGRDAEIEKLFCLLLPESAHSSSSSTTSSGVTMMVLTGPHGIGKTTLMNAFDRKVSTRRLLNQSRCNVCVFHNPPSSHSTAEPFSAWKPIICRAIQRFALSSRLEVDGAFIDGSNLRGVYLQSLDSLLNDLSPELREMKPLLGDVGIIDAMPDNEQTEGMARSDRLATLGDLLIELLLHFSKSRGWRLLIML